MVGRTLGRYRILSKIGQGGMATVWKAEDKFLKRIVALKTLSDQLAESPDARRRFLNEARVAAPLHHPGIAPVFTAEETEGVSYLVLAYIDGETLQERLDHGPLEWREATRVVIEAGRALAHAHGRGVIHRDVSSRNIMIARDGRAVVLDFGIALAAGATRFTSTSATLGTVAFIAPEVAGGSDADPRSDLYGLGVVFYHALTGVLPFRSERREAIFFLSRNQPPVPPRAIQPEIPESIEAMVLHALEKDPACRPATMEEWVEDLEAILAETSPGAPPSRSGRTMPQVVPASSETISTPTPSVPPSLPDIKYLLILPFEMQSDPEEPLERDGAFAASLAERIGSMLAGLAGLHVITPTAADALVGRGGDLRGLARATGANLVLRGSLRRQGSRVRVSYGLLDPFRGMQIGAGMIEESQGAMFMIEDRLALEIRALLGYRQDEARASGRGHDPAAHEHYLQALGYLRRQENEASVDGAISILERLVDTKEGSGSAFYAALGRAYLYKYSLTRHQMWEAKAASACERAISLDPQAPEAFLTLGDVHMESGNHADAVVDYHRAVGVAPDLVEAHLGLARAQEALGDLAGAEDILRKAIRQWPSDWRCHNRLGMFEYARGRFDDAIRSLRTLVQIAPDNSRAYLNLGGALFHVGQLEEAASMFRRSIEILPRASAFSNLGTVLYYLDRHEEAIIAFEKATQLRPLEPQVWGNLGNMLCWSPGHEHEAPPALERAIELMREGLERNPSDAEGWSHLGSWLANRGRSDEARLAIERALALAPRNARILARAGVTFEHVGERDRAVELLRMAVGLGHDVDILKREPTLHRLRQAPEFQVILGEARPRADRQEARTGEGGVS